MTADAASGTGARREKWRFMMWIGAAILLAVPAVAMKFSSEMAWGPEDFAVLGILLVSVCGAIELAARKSTHRAYRAGVALAAFGSFALIFVNLAVGIVGSEDNPINLVFFVIPALGLLGSAAGGFQPAAMARAFVAMAIVQLATLLVTPTGYMGLMIPFTGVFVAIWLLAARLVGAAALNTK